VIEVAIEDAALSLPYVARAGGGGDEGERRAVGPMPLSSIVHACHKVPL
jgi:hypothetical protein